ncbi:MAG: hypothetical protein E5W01_06550 [Mesorhizobium sp.]|nr:MAG: hypothetical protein E5W01_06550 [Mesorhizobium sp.]
MLSWQALEQIELIGALGEVPYIDKDARLGGFTPLTIAQASERLGIPQNGMNSRSIQYPCAWARSHRRPNPSTSRGSSTVPLS